MTFNAYRATSFSHAHENHVFNQLHDLLQQHWSEQDEPLHLLGNFYIDGAEVDALIIKRNAIIVIDFKDYGGTLAFSENGRWLMNGTEVRGGNKRNPYQQIRDNKFQLLNYLNNQVSFQSSPNLGHIAGMCLFHQNIEFDGENLPHNISRWFHIADMKSAIRNTDAIVSSGISLSDTDIQAILSQLNVPAYFPDGRSIEEPLVALDAGDDSFLEQPLNQAQSKALLNIESWLADTVSKVFALSGAFYSGKSRVLNKALGLLEQQGMSPLFLAPNARIANRYKSKGFSGVTSIYSWLYARRPTEIKKGKAIYPVNYEPVDAAKQVVVIFDAHLLGDDFFDTETTVYGSGFILRDLFAALSGSQVEGTESQTVMTFKTLPKFLLIGDPYQLSRGARDKSLLSCKLFDQLKIGVSQSELSSQDRDELAPIERLDFQKELISQIKAHKFVQLPICAQGSIKTIKKGEHTAVIAEALLQWPRRTAFLCATNEAAKSVNASIRRNFLNTTNLGYLVSGDIIDIHNRTPNLHMGDVDDTDNLWVSSGEFARVISVDNRPETKSALLKGREAPVVVEFCKAEVEYAGGTAEILYLPDFLAADKPELTQDQQIALQIWAREEADAYLLEEKNKLDAMDSQTEAYQAARSRYQDQQNLQMMSSRYTNAARLRYAYGLTVHRAQAYEPVPLVVLDGSSAHDTENPATESYFRWLYTATTCTSDGLQILEYPELTPLSKADWSFSSARISPITFKPAYYYQSNRVPTDSELSTPLPSGFSNPAPQLLALLLSIYDSIESSAWNISTITQHNYKERYIFESEEGEVAVDFNYNGKFEVTIGTLKVMNGLETLASNIKILLATNPVFKDENISTSVSIFTEHLARRNWTILDVDEKPYKVYIIAECDLGKIKVELNVPSDSSVSKKGMISSVKVQQADTDIVSAKFEKDFYCD